MRWVWVLALLAACGSLSVVDRAEDGRPILIRSGQPTALTLRNVHDRHGLKTVVNLRGESPGKAWFEDERRGVEEIGARWVQLDLDSGRAPPPEQVAELFDVLEDPGNWPVLVHCQGGVHRTGFVVALYRMQYQGWTAEQAERELRRNGFLWGKDRDALLEYLRSFEPDPERRLEDTR